MAGSDIARFTWFLRGLRLQRALALPFGPSAFTQADEPSWNLRNRAGTRVTLLGKWPLRVRVGSGAVFALGLLQSIQQANNYWTDLQVAFLPEVSHPIIASEQLISTCSGSSRPSTRSALMTLSGHCEPIRERPLPDVPGNGA